MSMVRSLMIAAVFLGIVIAAGESFAVIYKIVSEKGEPVYVDDLAKVPEKDRDKAVIVSGQNEHELSDDADRSRALAARQAGAERALEQAPALEPFTHRLVRSGIAALAVVAVFFVVANIDALKEQVKLVRNIRIGLIAALVVFIGFTHGRDVVGLLGQAGGKVAEPIAEIQEKQAERGTRAAASLKAMEQRVQNSQDDMDRLQKQFEDAEQGK
jgi:hypothetical protein